MNRMIAYLYKMCVCHIQQIGFENRMSNYLNMLDVCLSHASYMFVNRMSDYQCMLDVYMSHTSNVFVN